MATDLDRMRRNLLLGLLTAFSISTVAKADDDDDDDYERDDDDDDTNLKSSSQSALKKRAKPMTNTTESI